MIMLKLTTEIKEQIGKSFSGIFYDWYFMEIEHHCNERGVKDSEGLKSAIEFLITDSENEPNFQKFLRHIHNTYFK